jgi:Flp pilus assembly protein TadG
MFVRHRRFARFRSESGVSLIHVALLLFVMMGLSMFVTDYGVLWLARGQAQNAADAGALAAAVSLAFDPSTDYSTAGPAYNAGSKAATTNLVFGTTPTTVEVYVDPATSGSWAPAVPAICTSIGGCAQVNVYRTGMPTWFANVFGINSQQIRATATAQARGANSVRCLKPFGILDKWQDERLNTGVASDRVWHSGENGDTPISTYDRWYSPTGSSIAFLNTPPTLDSYTQPSLPNNNGTSFVALPWPSQGDIGRQLALTVGKQNDRPPMGANGSTSNPFTAGWFIPVSPGGGNTVDYKAAITGCISQTISIGQTLDLLNVPGNRVQKTAQAVGCGPPDMSGCSSGMYAQDPNSLYNQDPGAHWVNGQVVGSCCALSPRIVPAAIVSPDQYITGYDGGSSTITLINMIGLFIDGFRVSDEKVVVHVMRLPAEFTNSGGAVPGGNSFLEYVSLVR